MKNSIENKNLELLCEQIAMKSDVALAVNDEGNISVIQHRLASSPLSTNDKTKALNDIAQGRLHE